MKEGKRNLKISFNSPIVLGFGILCFVALIADMITQGWINLQFFSVYHSSLLNPLTYVRFFGHVVGHAGWDHLIGNMMLILVVGPLLEEKYGSANILFVILSTGFVTGLLNYVLFPEVRLLGASGVVFAFILLSSFTSIKEGHIPLTFILVAIMYLGEQVVDGIFVQDNVSNFSHIVGGVVGAVLGSVLNKKSNR